MPFKPSVSNINLHPPYNPGMPNRILVFPYVDALVKDATAFEWVMDALATQHGLVRGLTDLEPAMSSMSDDVDMGEGAGEGQTVLEGRRVGPSVGKCCAGTRATLLAVTLHPQAAERSVDRDPSEMASSKGWSAPCSWAWVLEQ